MRFLRALSKYALMKGLRFSGLPWLFREVLNRRKVTILTFHDPSVETARVAFDYFRRNYNVVSLRDCVRYLGNESSVRLPEKPLVITFDDGHAAVFDLLPLFQEFGLSATIFLCAGIVGTRRAFWFRHEAGLQDKEHLKKVSNRRRLAILADRGFDQERELDIPQALTRSQIERMQSCVDFQSHTLFHPCLPMCSDEEAWGEIARSKEVLESEFELNVFAIAFPNGDYSERDILLCKEAGYHCALTVDHGVNDRPTELYRLKRISVDSIRNLDEIIVKSSGVWGYLRGMSGRKGSQRNRTLSDHRSDAPTYQN